MQAHVTNRYGRVHLKCVPVLNIKAHKKRRDIKSSILNLGTIWRRFVKFMPKIGGPQRRSARILDRPSFSLITIAMTLSQLLLRESNRLKSQRSL